MRIFFQRSGGIAGTVMETTLDSAELSPEQIAELTNLIESASFFSQPEKLEGPPGSADDYEYRLSVEDGTRKHAMVFDRQATPTEMKPLVRWLSATAAPKKSA
jgi:hypothetical protein